MNTVPTLPAPVKLLLNPAPLEVAHVRGLYALGDREWMWHSFVCWSWLRERVAPEFMISGQLPATFDLLPIIKAHAQWGATDRRRQAAHFAAFDIIEPYLLKKTQRSPL